ncbi:hypothetical protein MauCBS54593_006288 [Microsporum audouinii]
MAEAVGLAVGLVSLAALFNNAVECFDYIQLGRHFGKDFQTCQLRLDSAKLRLSRWGASLGLNRGGSQGDIALSPQEMAQAQALMGQILELFTDAEGISNKFKSQARTDAAAGRIATANTSYLAVFDPATDLDPPARELHEKMRLFAIDRQKQTGLRQKAKWALYEKKNFSRLLEDITVLVDALVELVPASHSPQEELCRSEVAILARDETSLSLLKHTAAQQDRLLEVVTAGITNNNVTATFSTPVSGGFQVGCNTGFIQTYIHQPAELPELLSRPGSTIPFLRDRDFVVREEILNQIGDRATPGFWAALVGLGGVGKSQLAIEHGYRIRDKSPETWVFWVYASNSARFEESYREIADRAKIPGRAQSDNILKLVYDWLCSQSGKWFIILDNADNTDFLRKESHGNGLIKYIPREQNGSVLITSRSREAALQLVDNSDIITVEPMDKAHSIALLRIKLGSMDVDNESLARLAAALEFMPLAIVQAAAYISQRAQRLSVEKYLEKFHKSDSRKTNLLSHEGGRVRRDHDAKNSIITTWQISFDHIKEKRPSAADLLSYMSFFDRQGIPESMLHHYRDDMEQDKASSQDYEDGNDNVPSQSELSEDDDFENDLQTLKDYSFISVSTDPSVFEMHRLVQLATRTWLDVHGLLETWKQQFIRQLSTKLCDDSEPNCSKCQILFPHAKLAIDLEPENKDFIPQWAGILSYAVFYAVSKGNVTDAESLSAKSIAVCKREFGEVHKLTMDSKYLLTMSYYAAGKWAKAAELGEEALEERKQLSDVENHDTLVSLGILALIYTKLGRLAEAEEMDVRVLEISKKILGIEHQDTLAAIDNLAIIYSAQEKWEKAYELAAEVVEVEKRMLGLEHLATLFSMEILAEICRKLNMLEVAVELGEQVVEVSSRNLGAENIRTLTAMLSLSAAYREQGRLEEAEELAVKVMELKLKVRGIEHPNTWVSMAHVARIYGKQGRWNEGEELNLQVLEFRKRVLGTSHRDTLRTMNNLACIWDALGKRTDAINLMSDCVQLQIKHLGPEHQRTLKSSKALARWKSHIPDS